MILGKSLLQQLTATKAPSPPSTPPNFCFLPLSDFTFPDLFQIILYKFFYSFVVKFLKHLHSNLHRTFSALSKGIIICLNFLAKHFLSLNGNVIMSIPKPND